MSAQTDLTLRKSVTVNCSPERAFELFTDGLATWWPFDSHSPSEGRPDSFVFEPRQGGRVYERVPSGEETDWATVTAWEPPGRLAVDWHVTAGAPATQLEVRFTAEDGGTRVDLTHGGWERYGEKAAEMFDSYNGRSGWDAVLGRYVATANA